MSISVDMMREFVKSQNWLDVNKGELPEDGEQCLVFDMGFHIMTYTKQYGFREIRKSTTDRIVTFVSDGPLWLPLPDEKALEKVSNKSIVEAIRNKQDSAAIK